MKKRVFSIFLALALILTALAGCGKPNDADSTGSIGPEENGAAEQLLSNGYYEVHDEDDELAGYLRVMSSKLVVYDEHGSEKDSLRYDYDAEKGLYTIDGGELFGCEEFTVEKSGNALTLITEDEDEYTLEEIDKSDMPSGEEAPSDEVDPGYIELPVGCYAGYDDDYIFGYLKVMNNKMIFYYNDGEIEGEASYSYDSEGNCHLEMFDTEITVQFTYEQGSYYMNSEGDSRRLEPISESEIPENKPSSDMDAYFIGANGSIALYVWLPEAMYDDLYVNNDKGYFTAEAECYDYDTDTHLMFAAAAASGDALQEGIDEAKAGYDGIYSSDADLLFNYLRESFIEAALDDFPGDLHDGYETINGREWRYFQTYSEEDGTALALLFWMEGDDMVLMAVGGTVEGSGSYDDMAATLIDIISSLKFDA